MQINRAAYTKQELRHTLSPSQIVSQATLFLLLLLVLQVYDGVRKNRKTDSEILLTVQAFNL